jgi:hypothetical protein
MSFLATFMIGRLGLDSPVVVEVSMTKLTTFTVSRPTPLKVEGSRDVERIGRRP